MQHSKKRLEPAILQNIMAKELAAADVDKYIEPMQAKSVDGRPEIAPRVARGNQEAVVQNIQQEELQANKTNGAQMGGWSQIPLKVAHRITNKMGG